jgi:hypothetical protein
MVAVRMMQMTIDKIIDVIAVRNRLVAAAGAVDMLRVMTAAAMLRRAGRWVGRRNRQLMLLYTAIGVDVVQVPVVQVVDVTIMLQTGVFAIRAVLVIVIGVQVSHAESPLIGVE